MSIPNDVGPESNHFLPEMMDRVKTVESLPDSHAFEQVMYENHLIRVTEHKMMDPITLSPTLLNGKFPKEVKDIFPASEYAIEDLIVQQTKNAGTLTPSLEMSFTANGTPHSLHTEGDSSVYETENYNNDKLTYTLSRGASIGLLAALVYARQFDEQYPKAPIDLEESLLGIPRSADEALVEQLIMTLGNRDGTSAISTTALFGTANGGLVARLIEGERPNMSIRMNRIELTRLVSLEDTSTRNNTTIHEALVNIKTETSRAEHYFAERYTSSDVPDIIDPKYDYEEWSKICNEFFTAIKGELDKYAYLDETL